ncbi:MAG: ATP-dependent helicase [Clostridia bacterium]|nr:ATP-dependent helicase [Clostridia bacterium]
MSKIVKLVDGHLTYSGMLSSKDIASIDDILSALQKEIPDIESTLNETYGNNVWYKYYLGQFLRELLEKYQIPMYERRLFWDEIKYLASTEVRTRDEGKNSTKRSFYEQCYTLSQLDKSIVEKLAWRQWQSLLDRGSVREDSRIFQWIGNLSRKPSGEEWREFEKALNLFLKNKDLSVFEDEELFKIYDSLFQAGTIWLQEIKKFSKEHPKSRKLESSSKTKWSKKYYALCFEKKKGLHLESVTKELCHEAFSELFNN